MPKPKKRKSFVYIRVKLAGQLPVVAEQPSSSTSEVVMLAGEVVAHKSEFTVQVEAAAKKLSRSTLRPARTRRPTAAS